MTVTVATMQFTSPAGTGNFNITTTDLGSLTPKAVVFQVCRGSTNGVAASHAAISFGAATGAANEWSCSAVSQTSSASTNTKRRARTNNCITLLGTGGGDSLRANFVSFITNGVQVNFTGVAAQFLVTATFFAGDISAHADIFSPGISVDSGVNVTDPGFQPDLVFFAAHGEEFDDTTHDNHRFSVGATLGDGTQMSLALRENDGNASGSPEARLQSDRAMYVIDNNNYACQIGDFDGDGFTSTLRLNSAGTDDVGYLALALGTDLYLATQDTPVLTGNEPYTAPGFQPNLLMLLTSFLESVDSTATNDDAGSYGMSSIDVDDQSSVSVSIEDGSATTDTQSLADNFSKAINTPADSGATGLEADFVSFDANGWTLDFTAVEANAKKFIALAIGPESGGVLERRFFRGVGRGVIRGVT